MTTTLARFTSSRQWRRFAITSVSLCLGLAATSLQARPVPQNLAGGLDALVESNLALKAQANSKGAPTAALYNGYATQRAADYAERAIQDAGTGRFLVDIYPSNNRVNAEKLVSMLQQRFSSFKLTALNKKYHGVGVVEGFISLDDVPALGNMREVRSVSLGLRPELNRPARTGGGIQPGTTLPLLGTAFDQGVYQHRVDQINKFYNPSADADYEGSGISIGFLSDSYGNSATDVANFDLPGAGGNPLNPQPVVVLQDITATDEGRGMVQIGYKMAPKARLGFATGATGEVAYANNIRALAALPGFEYPPRTQQGFKADVICDDIGYGDEPFFQDGIIAEGVDDAAAVGVAYFSSAGNDIGTYDYDSDYRNVPNGPGALTGTNIKLAGVPSNLYQGGFHDFNPAHDHQDIAQTVNVPAVPPATNFQWDDPYNQVLDFDPNPIYTNHAVYNNTPLTFTTPSLTAGQNYVITVTADSGSTFDAIVTIKDPNGNIIVNMQDTGTDETINLYPPITGPYMIIVTNFGGTTGAFTVNIYNGSNPQLTTDFNLLVFDLEGNYLSNSSLTTNNYATNIPFEFGVTAPKTGETQVQYVIARSSVPSAPQPATHIRWIIRGNGLSGIGPAEYFKVNSPNTKGHAMANGCNGTAAYSVFRPNIPEYYTSPGPATVYFDMMGNRLPTPEVRRQPGVAAADNANTSFFGFDSASDLDIDPNFSGTSAASPHAAAVAALVLQAHGGTGSVTPTQMMDLLHNSAFQHDLDPNFASGRARTSEGGRVIFTANTDLGLNPSSGVNNVNHLTVSYKGPGALTSLVFNPEGTAQTGGNTTGGNNGLDLTNTYFSNIYPGIVFEPSTKPFTVGTSDVSATDISAAFSNQAPLPSIAGQFWTMSLSFANNTFTSEKTVRFTVGHGPQHNSTLTNGTGPDGGATSTAFTQADLFGKELLLPDGTIARHGMTFSGTTSGGGTFSGTIENRAGAGYSNLDGYGFLNAEAAVKAPLH
ncbi:MAG: S8 family serine peptidase [Chthoniobacterales bacterium]|nr:S8 family serine peptidase [Chthoniobacterales bacterium]